MLELSSWFIIGLIFVFIYIYFYGELCGKKRKNLNFKDLLICILVSLIGTFVSIHMNNFFLIIFKYVLMLFMLKLIYNDKIPRTTITTLCIYILFIICEFLFALVFIFLLNIDQNFIKYTIYGYYFSNFVIILTSFVFMKITLIKGYFQNVIKWYLDKEMVNLIFVSFIAIITVGYLLYQNYLEVTSKISFMIVNTFLFGIVVFIIGYFKEKTDNNKLSTKYDSLLDFVTLYEEIIENQSKKQHEYQNQLILIREMIGKKNKKILTYINEQLKVEDVDVNYKCLNKLNNIPDIGLKGLIRYKVSQMLKQGIKIYINISSDVNMKEVENYISNNLKDISKIVGVYIDNAMETSLISDDKYIIIEFDLNDRLLEFSISNTYKGTIKVNNMDKAGYSSNGKNRGYGLSLVKDIIESHDDIKQFREINGKFFEQKIAFNIK